MLDARPRSSGGEELEAWEKHLIQSVAARYDTLDREDLAADLAWRLLVLKRQRRPGIRNWRAYVGKFLRNKALNWIRDNRPREESTISLDAPIEAGDDAGETFVDLLHAPESDADQLLALKRAIGALPSDLRSVLRVLIEENWSQTNVARRLHKHRNTIRAWIRKIRPALIAHGLGPEPDARKTRAKSEAFPRKPIRQRRRLTTIPLQVLRALTDFRMNGSQWRLALWVISRSSTRQQRTIPFTWRAIGRALAMDHAGVRRYGIKLLRFRVLFIDGGRIGFERNFFRWRIGSRI